MYSRVWERQGKSKTLSCSEEGNSSTSRKQRGNKLCRNPGRSFLRGGLHWPWSANMQVHLLKAVKCLFRLTNGTNILYRLYSFTLAFCLGEGVFLSSLKQVQRERKTYKSTKARKTLAIQQDAYKYTIWGQGKVTSSVI